MTMSRICSTPNNPNVTHEKSGGNEMSKRELLGKTAIVTGASRGFGRVTAVSLAALGAHVVGIARSAGPLDELRENLGKQFTPEVADVADPMLPARLFSLYKPQILVLNAGATPAPSKLQEQTWGNFSMNWNVDVQHVFNFAREALTTPLDAGSVVVSLSSGAALGGSPMSGGYAAAKSAIKFISAYAESEARRGGLNIRFVAVLPQLSPATELGRIYAETYAAQAGLSVSQFVQQRFGGTLGTDQAGESICEIAANDSCSASAYLLTPAGLQPVD
jgi:NAD(P)-dependent dehydrogenase (short-subunit alcohol dehydrogenase family)